MHVGSRQSLRKLAYPDRRRQQIERLDHAWTRQPPRSRGRDRCSEVASFMSMSYLEARSISPSLRPDDDAGAAASTIDGSTPRQGLEAARSYRGGRAKQRRERTRDPSHLPRARRTSAAPASRRHGRSRGAIARRRVWTSVATTSVVAEATPLHSVAARPEDRWLGSVLARRSPPGPSRSGRRA